MNSVCMQEMCIHRYIFLKEGDLIKISYDKTKYISLPFKKNAVTYWIENFQIELHLQTEFCVACIDNAKTKWILKFENNSKRHTI